MNTLGQFFQKELNGESFSDALRAAEGMYYLTWNLDYPNDDTWTHGYSKTEPKITIAHNQGTEMVAKVGTILQFANGDQYEILQVEDTGETYIFTLNSDTPLNYFKYGSLNDVTYYSAEGEPYTVGSLSPYISQYGLQGKVFRHIARGEHVAHIVLGQQNVGALGVELGLVVAHPQNLRGGKACQGGVGGDFKQPLLAHPLGDFLALGGGALVAPDDGAAQQVALLVQHHQAVHLARRESK